MTTLNPERGKEMGMATYYRRSDNQTGANGMVPWMIFADSEDAISSYGKHLFTARDDIGHVVDAADLISEIAEILDDPEITREYQCSGQDLASEANPENIVNSAGLWDNPDLTQLIWDEILEPSGIQAVRTQDGLVVFDPDIVQRVDE